MDAWRGGTPLSPAPGGLSWDCHAVPGGDKMWFRIAADVVVAVHLLFIGFVVGGVFAAWRWPRIVWAHLPAVAYGALVEFVGFTCPLTPLENYLRRRAGEAGYRGGFIAHYLVTAIYPPGLTRGMQTGVGVLVLLIAITGYWGLLRRHAAGLTRAWHTGTSAGGGVRRQQAGVKPRPHHIRRVRGDCRCRTARCATQVTMGRRSSVP